jgi:hypothetical protein
MEDITRFPDIEGLALEIKPKGHSFGASVFHVLRMCTGVKRLRFTLMDVISHTEVTLSFPYLSDSCYAFIFLGTPTLNLLSSHTVGVSLILDTLLQIICMEKKQLMYLAMTMYVTLGVENLLKCFIL